MEAEQIQQYQWESVQRLITYAAQHVPYYRKLFADLGVQVRDFKQLADITALPVLRKRDIRDNFKDLQSEIYPRERLRYDSTGGSTGHNLYFYYDQASSEARRAAYVEMNEWIGIHIGDRTAYLWGTAFDASSSAKIKHWIKAQFTNELMLSAYTMDPVSVELYTRRLSQFRPRAIVSYPSALAHFAQSAKASGKTLFRPSVVVVSGETLFDWQRETIEEAFGAKVYNHYGCREFGAMARECRIRDGLHLASDRLLVEVVPAARSSSGEEISELVVTDLDNYGMPFIRYAIEDVGEITWERCACGLRLPRLRSAIGRTLDVVRAPNGNFLGGTFWTILLRKVKGVAQFQVIQDKLDSVTIAIVPTPEFSDDSRSYVLSKIREACGPGLVVHFDLKDKLETTGAGKHRFVISRIGLGPNPTHK